jgi:hypothetical protein
MDPYLEGQGFWPDFHFRLIAAASQELSSRLPDAYAALIEERISLGDVSSDDVAGFRPDITIDREDRGGHRRGGHGSVATIEPVTLPLARWQVEKVTHRWIEIKRLPDLSPVTVIEILSPANKTGLGRREYLQKRMELLDQPVHLVEIDLLLGGSRIPLGAPLPPGDYFAMISRAEDDDLANCDVYAWSIRRALPTIPLPLLEPDPDIPLDLAAAVERAYDQGRYGRLVNYALPMDLSPLDVGDRVWAETQVQAK